MVRQWNSLSELCVTTRSTMSTLGLSLIHLVMVSPIASRSRANVVENTLTPVNELLVTDIPTSLLQNLRIRCSPTSYHERPARRAAQAASSLHAGPIPSG